MNRGNLFEVDATEESEKLEIQAISSIQSLFLYLFWRVWFCAGLVGSCQGLCCFSVLPGLTRSDGGGKV